MLISAAARCRGVLRGNALRLAVTRSELRLSSWRGAGKGASVEASNSWHDQVLESLLTLRRCAALRGLERPRLHGLATMMRPWSFMGGEEIVFAQRSGGIHFLVSGRVEVSFLARESGRELLLWTLEPPEVLTDVAALSCAAGSVRALALEPTHTLHLPQQALADAFRRYPELTLEVLAALSKQQQTLVSLLGRFAFNNLTGRLAHYLVEALAAGLPYALEPNAHIAGVIGSVPEVVSRTLWQFHREGVIRLEGRTVVAADLERLEALSLCPNALGHDAP
jgi:CRP-like cAMP-binding protein